MGNIVISALTLRRYGNIISLGCEGKSPSSIACREGSAGARPCDDVGQPPPSLRVKARRTPALKGFKRSRSTNF